MRYRSKIDAWLAVTIGVATAVGCFGAIALIRVGSTVEIVSFVPILLASLVLPLSVLFGTHYTLSPELLDIRCGWFRFRVPIASIKDVRPTRSAASSPALSLDRLEIIYGKFESVMISPEDRERFTAELTALREKSRTAENSGPH